MNPEAFVATFNKIASVGGTTTVDGQPGTAEELFAKIRQAEAANRLFAQSLYQAFSDYKDAADAGQPVLGRRPKCDFHATTQPVGHLTCVYV